jgi:hypothetical protein
MTHTYTIELSSLKMVMILFKLEVQQANTYYAELIKLPNLSCTYRAAQSVGPPLFSTKN